MQVEAATAELENPAGQKEHSADPSVAAKYPAVQFRQLDWPASDVVPIGQTIHEVAFTTLLYSPGLQETQPIAPVTLEIFPAEQNKQVDEPGVEKKPGVHTPEQLETPAAEL
jgi:hypothetical protein